MPINQVNEALYNNRLLVPNALEITGLLEQRSASFRDAARAELDIPYGAGERSKFDLFMPQGEDWQTLVVFIHGGYWQMRDRKDFSALARGTVENGLAVAMPSYDLCPDVTIGDIINQLRGLCKHLHRTYGKPLVIAGHSAGGHLTAAMLGTDWAVEDAQDMKILGAVPISGVFDLMGLIGTTINEPLKLNPDTAKLWSPLLWTPRVKVPMRVYVGGGESQGFLDQSRWLVDTWGPYGVDAEYIEIAHANHFTVIAELEDKDSAMAQTILKLAA